jgi:transposase-like protein
MAAILSQPHFQDPEAAREYLEKTRWPNGVVCPHCGVIGGHYKLPEAKHTRPGVHKCGACSQKFSVTVGTVFESSHIKLHIWLQAVHLMSASKKGISAKQLERMLGVTYKSAWFMAHRIREAMNIAPQRLLGEQGQPVEVDETYWGNKTSKERTRGSKHSMKVVSLVERDGEKRSVHVPSVNYQTLRPILLGYAAPQARLITDEGGAYKAARRDFASHQKVNHSVKEYARGDVTTNTVESSFAILKRGLYGTFHSVSEAHLQRYATEFDFRWNYRAALGFNDVQRATMALKSIAGKRLTYRA